MNTSALASTGPLSAGFLSSEFSPLSPRQSWKHMASVHQKSIFIILQPRSFGSTIVHEHFSYSDSVSLRVAAKGRARSLAPPDRKRMATSL